MGSGIGWWRLVGTGRGYISPSEESEVIFPWKIELKIFVTNKHILLKFFSSVFNWQFSPDVSWIFFFLIDNFYANMCINYSAILDKNLRKCLRIHMGLSSSLRIYGNDCDSMTFPHLHWCVKGCRYVCVGGAAARPKMVHYRSSKPRKNEGSIHSEKNPGYGPVHVWCITSFCWNNINLNTPDACV